MVEVIKKAKINDILNLFSQMFVNMNYLFNELKEKKKEIVIFTKAENEKFTNFDWAIQKMVENHMNAYLKGINFIGEENTKEESVEPEFSRFLTIIDEIKFTPFSEEFVGDFNEKYPLNDLYVYYDPIDSTSSFIKGNYAPVTGLVGITYKGEPIIGMVHFPSFEEKSSKTFLNVPGKGVFCIDYLTSSDAGEYSKVEYKITKVNPLKQDKFNFCITATRENPTMTKVLSFFPDHDVVRVSGLGNKSMVAFLNGYFYFAPSKGLGFWDICGPHALMKEVGGDCCYISGERITYPENYEQRALDKCMCMGTDFDKITKFIEVLKKNDIQL
jgi:3'(2'), 5'-bisphosphate nucleotidase